jgi:hypothetical protein
MIDPKKIAEWKRIEEDSEGDNSLRLFLYGQALPALLFERDELIALLREIQWAAVAGYRCPICRGRRPGTLSHYDLQDPGLDHSEGHAPDCRLARALADSPPASEG